MNNDLVGLLAPLIPTPRAHFLIAGQSPAARGGILKSSVLSVMKSLFDSRNILASVDLKKGAFISSLNVMRGIVDPSHVYSSLQTIQERKLINFTSNGLQGIQVTLANRSPFDVSQNKISGAMLANHTGMYSLINKSKNKYTQMRKRGGFISNFTKETKFDLEEFTAAEEEVTGLLDEYKTLSR